MDMYRKVPTDLLEGTKRGSFFSICALGIMFTLFYLETQAFFTKTLIADLLVDTNKDEKLRLNFNITMLEIPCDFTIVDVVSVFGTEQNVSQNVHKWELDGEGQKARFQGRNKEQKEIKLHDETVTDSLEVLHENGEDAIDMDGEELKAAIEKNDFLFVNFHTPGCAKCNQLAPTWETLAEVMHEVASETLEQLLKDKYPDGKHGYSEEEFHDAAKVHVPVVIAKVDCMKNPIICYEWQVHAFPTLRLFVDGKKYSDYRSDRTIHKFTGYLSTVEKEHLEISGDVARANDAAIRRLPEALQKRNLIPHGVTQAWKKREYPGCQLSGFLLVDRVPGNFRIKAKAQSHEFVPSMTNVSHVVHSFSVGDPRQIRMIENNKVMVPKDLKEQIQPMNDISYVTDEAHSAYHHHMKIVTTNYETKVYRVEGRSYQVLAQSEITRYDMEDFPEAKFSYDLSPVAITYRQEIRRWYDYLTSVMAIIGGSFTVIGMMESAVHAIASKRRY